MCRNDFIFDVLDQLHILLKLFLCFFYHIAFFNDTAGKFKITTRAGIEAGILFLLDIVTL